MPDMREDIATAIGNAFTALGDIPETVTYRQRTDGSYNAATGVVSHTDTDTSVSAVVEPLTGGQEPNIIAEEHSGDLSFTFQQSDLSVEPNTNDEIIRNSEVYTVSQIIADPAGATFRIIGSRQG
ncbi:MAG: hypothetical protein HOE82_06755 [Gammaproteobacteria bacterium]|nr:hypothetical protein [Gammaproteobacteria bacterium]